MCNHAQFLKFASTVALGAALCSQMAVAQDAPVTPQAAEQGIGEIIVTAQRRSESVQKSSLSIQVLSADDIIRNGANGPRDLNTLVPGLAVSQGGTFTQTFIRGVGDVTSNAFGSNGVMYSIDGIVIDRPTSITTNFFDLQRIEVLKGPQGTLYGRNSTGGAINLISRRPGSEFGGYITADVGNYDMVSILGAIDLPVSDTLRMRAAFNAARRDGFLTDGRNDDDRRAGRLTVEYKPSSDFSLLVIGDIQHMGGKGPGGVVNPLPAAATTAWSGPSDPAVLAQLRAMSPIALLPDANAAFMDGNFRNLTAEINGNLGFATATLLAGYRHVSTRSQTAQPGFDSIQNDKSDQYSIEGRLSNQSTNLKWVVGALYFAIDQSQDTTVLLNGVAPFGRNRILYPSIPTRSYGLFGEATYSIMPDLRIIGGVRYSDETKKVSGSNNDLVTGRPPVNISGSQSFSKITWKAGAEYDLTPQNMLYATVSTGFKAGGFSPVPPPNLEFGPETLTSYVAGSRNRFLNDMLQVNVEGFYWKYKDYQVAILGPQPNGINGIATYNAGAATIYGIDVDLVAKLSPRDTIRFVGEYLNAKFDTFIFDRTTAGIAVATACPIVGPVRTVFGGPVQSIDCSGFPLPRAPKWTGAGSYQHVFPLANGGNVDFKGSFSYSSARYLSVEYTAPTKASAYATFDADLTYNAPESRFSLTAYVRNIGNKAFFTGGSFQPLSGSRLFYQTIGSPRTYGVRATVNF